MSLVTYEPHHSVACIRMEDGKANALSPRMLECLNEALERAQAEERAIVLCGRPGVFSAGFDRGVLAAGGRAAADMFLHGFALSERLLSFPRPVVVACGGHALAMGAFLLLSVDHRIGAEGAFKIGANEVAIGLTMPRYGIEISRQRLAPAYFQRSVINAEIHGPAQAVSAGFLDTLVAPAELDATALRIASELAQLPASAYAATKLRTRAHALDAIRQAIELDTADFRALFG
jgi:enoyl-CoA hydratase